MTKPSEIPEVSPTDVSRIARELATLPLTRRRAQMRRMKFTRLLYKYMSLSATQPERLGYMREIVVENKFYLCSPGAFNDPFDSRISQRFTGTPAQRMDGLRRLAKRVFPNTSREDRERWAREAMKKAAANAPFDGGHQFLTTAGVCVFTRNGRNTLLWAHYADSHRGACLIFEVAQSPLPFIQSVPMAYEDRYATVNYGRDSDDAIAAAYKQSITSKATNWAYEDEERIISLTGAGKHVPFSPPALLGIALGISAPRRAMDQVLEMLADRAAAGHPPVKLFRAHACTNAHRIRLYNAYRQVPAPLDLPPCRLSTC